MHPKKLLLALLLEALTALLPTHLNHLTNHLSTYLPSPADKNPHTDLEYLDTPKLEADYSRISLGLGKMRNNVGGAAPASVACQAHVDELEADVESLRGMEEVLVPVVPATGQEWAYVVHTLRRVRDGMGVAEGVLRELGEMKRAGERAC
ncbi:uncharacterized protein BKCO1_25000106 [Diplodia corticola]|uniref:Uncharacterized protein n=1 Tax=Diplodia corticola TaxID=236234 RepID=A0A1J9R1H1_9PEZI|nr:uncharacterized protein BKCO1_25000106 [Diplodia corticola]OJD34090.1 hypothetical protein BKCO1_25000106 [Diplodia corticola]